MTHLLSRTAIENRGLLVHAPVAQLIADHEANRGDGTDRLLSLLTLDVWPRIFLGRRTPADVSDELNAVLA